MVAIEPPAPLALRDAIAAVAASGEHLMLSAAMSYARSGWHVFPVHSPGRSTYCDCGNAACTQEAKHPWVKGGFHAATTDLTQIRQWWRKWPRANIGIACGASGLVVLDVDARHDGERALVELVRRHAGAKPGQLTPAMVALCATLASETGGGGSHYIYRMPAGVSIRNTQELDGLAGLDVRGDGGYLVVTPSMHVSGARYLWREGAREPRAVPDWLLPVLTQRRNRAARLGASSTQATQESQATSAYGTTNGTLTAVASNASVADSAQLPETADLALNGAYWLERALRLAHEGNRNDTGFWLACQLRDSGLSEDSAVDLLEDYAARVPGSDYSPSEAVNSLRSAYGEPPRERARSRAAMSTQTAISSHTSLSDGSSGSLLTTGADMPPGTPAALLPNAMAGATAETRTTTTTAVTSDAGSGSVPKSPRFRFLSDSDLDQLPKPEWLIEGFLLAGSFSTIYGESGSYKSFLALDFALSVATGTIWHGHQVKRGPVVYIAGEGKFGLRKRRDAWRMHHNYAGETGVYWLTESPQLLRAEDVLGLLVAIVELPERPALIVLDTLARALVGGDENSQQDMGVAVAAAERLRAETGAHVLLVHHKPTGADKLRGSSVLPAALETTIRLTKDGQTVKLHCDKQKEYAEFDDREMRFTIIPVDDEGETSGVLVPEEGGPRRMALPRSAEHLLAILRGTGGLRWVEIRQRFLSQSGMAQRSLNNAIEILEREGYAMHDAGLWRATEKGQQWASAI